MPPPRREYTETETAIRDEGRRIRLAKEQEQQEQANAPQPYHTATNAEYHPVEHR